MNNQKLITTLDRNQMLCLVELLSRVLVFERYDLDDLDDLAIHLSNEVCDYCETLSDYERLKLMQLIINTLVQETEQSAVQHFQTLLPLKPKDE